MNEKILNLYRKIITSLACISYYTNNINTKNIANIYLKEYLNNYKQYINKKQIIINVIDIINFSNDCYTDVDIFDYAEDIEYGIKELNEIKKDYSS